MKQVKEVLVSPWRGSEKTAEDVREQVRERFGDEVADEFDPAADAMPFSSWLAQGYAVRKGSKALKSITILEMKDPEDEKKVRKIKRTVNLFHRKEVDKIS
ncbi:hypothetical protein A3A41_01780 [Candidatus Kaiserbacteria bacterium RIFCSPLOWO2_01_FULL_54_22]|nr:MAG: hypothetical protein A3A41_01780 [Candidatus Kaiserbacteria bacterium RIFCSPLOWO2_01_FULL_54_22]